MQAIINKPAREAQKARTMQKAGFNCAGGTDQRPLEQLPSNRLNTVRSPRHEAITSRILLAIERLANELGDFAASCHGNRRGGCYLRMIS